jgi:hypothetical protein
MYAPLARSSLARLGSTNETHEVTRFILSLGDNIPQFAHWTSSLRPLPPLLRPRDLLFFGISLNPCLTEVLFSIKERRPSRLLAQDSLYTKKIGSFLYGLIQLLREGRT